MQSPGQLPDGLTRYTGANAFTTEDAAGNVFGVFQGPNDSGVCVMRRPDGTMVRAAHPPILGRPSLDCNPLVGLWVVGNKEAGAREFPPRYRIAEYVPFSAPTAPGGVAPEKAEPLPNGGQPYADNARAFGSERLTASDPWDRFLGPDGFFAARLNKIILVQAQIQRVLKKAGLLV